VYLLTGEVCLQAIQASAGVSLGQGLHQGCIGFDSRRDSWGSRRGSCGGSLEEFGLQFVEFDAFYLERLRSGNADTERHFFAYFSALIRLKLRTRLGSKEAIEDVRQETFVRVLALIRSEAGLKHPDRLGALVNSVCNNVLLEHYRSKSRKESSVEDEHWGTFIDPELGADDALAIRDTQRIVHQILSELPERDRRLLQCVLLEERDKGEICRELGVTRDYLRVLVHRAKQDFRSSYIRYLGEPDPSEH
jgi:RNA polymerase sigma-70 factor, ECF subfamily